MSKKITFIYLKAQYMESKTKSGKKNDAVLLHGLYIMCLKMYELKE